MCCSIRDFVFLLPLLAVHGDSDLESQGPWGTAPPLNPRCFMYNVRPNQEADHSFTTESLFECRRYCKSVGKCIQFSFHTLSGNCKLYQRPVFATNKTVNRPFSITAFQRCLECIGSVDDVVAAAANTSFLIKHAESYKCLTIDRNSSDTITAAMTVNWKSCINADEWEFHMSDTSYLLWEKQTRMISISSKRDPQLALAWAPSEQAAYEKLTRISLAERKEGSVDQLFVIMDTAATFLHCAFELTAPHYEDGELKGDYTNHLYTDSYAEKDRFDRVELIRSNDRDYDTCNLNQFRVRGGRLLNERSVPYFLYGAAVTVVCDPGLGVAAMNYSSLQVVTCGGSKEQQVMPCSPIVRQVEREVTDVKCHVYLMSAITTTLFLLIAIIRELYVKCANKV